MIQKIPLSLISRGIMQNSSIFGGWAWEETMVKRMRRNRTGICVAFQKGHVKRERYRGHAWKALRRVPWKTKVSLVAHRQLHTVRLMVLTVSANFFWGGFFGCWYYSKHFPCMISFNPYNDSITILIL